MRAAEGARDPLEAARSLFEGSADPADASHPAARFVKSYVGYLAAGLVIVVALSFIVHRVRQLRLEHAVSPDELG